MQHTTMKIAQAIRKQTGAGFKPFPTQLLDLIRLYWTKGITPAEYYSFGLADLGKTDDVIDSYVSAKWHWQHLVPRLNPKEWTPILKNKWLFHLQFGQGLCRSPRTLGLFHASFGRSITGERLRNTEELSAAIRRHNYLSLVCKPVAGMGGDSVMVFDKVDQGYPIVLRGKAGAPLTIAELVAFMTANNPKSGYLIQQRIPDHPFFAAINPYTPSSMRVITLRNPKGDIHLPLSVVRFGRKGQIVDNVSQGGFLAPVNPATGEIARAICRPFYLRNFMDTHPDSGARFLGSTIPMWQSVTDLCISAANAIPGLHAIGWDVILAPDGPVLIEGNTAWDPNLQAAAAGYLTRETRKIIIEHGLTL